MEEKEIKKGQKVIFLDRDGTMNEEVHYLHKPRDFILLSGVADAVLRFNKAGYQVVVVTNQAGVARGYYSEVDVMRLHEYLNEVLAESGAHVDYFYYCPHHPEHGVGEYKKNCLCRKPGIGMFQEAEKAFENGVNKEDSYMIGDKLLDIEAGHRYGIKSILVGTGYGKEIYENKMNDSKMNDKGKCDERGYDYYAADLMAAADFILL